MTNAIIITIMSSFIWAITNHIDKYMLCKINNTTSNIKTLLLFSSLIAGIVFTPIWLIISKFQIQISLISFISITISAILYILATYFYFKALEKNDASIIVVMFQLIPVFSYFLSLLFFKETLTITEILGSLMIISSAIIISLDFNEKSNKNKLIALVLMTISSLLYSLYYLSFDVAIRHSNYNSVAFFYQIGLILVGLILISIKSYRKEFIKMLKNNGKKIISLNITNEILNLVANLLINFANLTLPLAITTTLNGFQGAFVFITGVIGVRLFPKIFTEDLNKKVVIQKITCIILGITGLIIMIN